MTIIETAQRAAIREHQRSGKGHQVIQALAGTGKSSVGRDLIYDLPNGKVAKMYAHNKSIAKHNGELVKGRATSQTFHAAGRQMCIDHYGFQPGYIYEDKYKVIFYYLLVKAKMKSTEIWKWKEALAKVCAGLRQGLLEATPENCESVANRTGACFPHPHWSAIADLVTEGMAEGAEQACKKIDMTDMLWVPYINNIHPTKTCDYLYADEMQDASPSHIDLLQRLAGDAVVTVLGDNKQAIYQFLGADGKAIEQLGNYYHSTIFPLSVCFRCPTSVIDLAKKYVPNLEAAPGAEMGDVRELERGRLYEDGRYGEGDMVICRTRAPLIETYYQLLRHKVPCIISGVDIGEDLVALASYISQRFRFTFDRFGRFLTDHRDSKIKRMRDARLPEMEIESLRDRCAALMAIYEAAMCNDDGPVEIKGFCNFIEKNFSDKKMEHGVTLTTIHKSKGLQADNVYLLRPDLCPHKRAVTEEELQAEYNCLYIQYTRAQKTLTFLTE